MGRLVQFSATKNNKAKGSTEIFKVTPSQEKVATHSSKDGSG